MPVAHFTERAHALARGQRLLLAGIEMKKAQDELRVAVRSFLKQAHELPAASILDLGIGDGALDLPCLAGCERVQWAQVRMVFVTQRQMQDEILLAPDAEARELFLQCLAGR